MKKLCAAFILFFAAASGSLAQPLQLSHEAETRFITAYNQGFSGIFEVRTLTLSEGENLIEIRGIPELHSVERLTVLLDGELLEARIAKSEPGFASLMNRLRGTRVRLVNGQQAQEGLLRYESGIAALQQPGGQFISPDPASHFIYPLSGEVSLFGDSGLVLRVHANRAGPQRIGLLYGTNAIGWTVMHSLRLHPDTETYEWVAEAQIFNNSGMDFDHVFLRLFSGDVDLREMPRLAHTRIPRVLDVYDDMMMDMDAFLEMDAAFGPAVRMSSSMAAPPVQVQFEDFFAYDFPEPLLLPTGSVASVQLFHFRDLNYRSLHFLEIPQHNLRSLRTTRLAVLNENEANAIPTEAPPGEVYASSFPRNGMPVFEGISRISATPPGLTRYVATGVHVPVSTRHEHESRGGRRGEDRLDLHTVSMTNEGTEAIEVLVQRSIGNTRTLVHRMPEGFEQLGSLIRGTIRLAPGETQTFELTLRTPAL